MFVRQAARVEVGRLSSCPTHWSKLRPSFAEPALLPSTRTTLEPYRGSVVIANKFDWRPNPGDSDRSLKIVWLESARCQSSEEHTMCSDCQPGIIEETD